MLSRLQEDFVTRGTRKVYILPGEPGASLSSTSKSEVGYFGSMCFSSVNILFPMLFRSHVDESW